MRNAHTTGREIGENEIYIGRPGMWGNPFTFKGEPDPIERYERATREEAIEAYRDWLWKCIKSGAVKMESLKLLHGKVLVCWCTPLPCHGDVLAKAADWAIQQP